ncbi:hypothetical protein D3C73_589990 [compost metagenome]
MRAWWFLFKRELSLGASMTFPVWISAMIAVVLGGLSVYLAYQFQSGMLSQLWLIIIYLHLFGPAVYLLLSFRRDYQRSPLWLQLPLPAWKLLLAKYAAAFTELMAGLVTSTILFLWVHSVEKKGAAWLSGDQSLDSLMPDADKQAQFMIDLLRGSGSAAASILAFVLTAFAIASLLVLPYLLAYAWTPRFGRWRWFMAILAVGAALFVEFIFEMTPIYSFLAKWGYVGSFLDEALYLGEIAWISLNVAVILYICAWLVDRKVEV